MKTFGKILGLSVLILLIALVGLGFALTHLFNPNDYKEDIRQLVREQAGLELSIRGDIGWSLFPWLGLELNDTTLASIQTPEQPFAELKKLGLAVQVMPLLQQQIRMSDINLDGLDLNLIRTADGTSNWESSASPEDPEEHHPDDTRAETEAEEETRQAIALDIDSLNVTNARIHYQDDLSGQQFTLNNLYLTATTIREGAAIPVTLMAHINSGQPIMQVRTELQTVLQFDTHQQRYELKNLHLSGTAKGDPLNGQTLEFSAQGHLMADLLQQTASWKALQLSINQLQAKGELNIQKLLETPKLTGQLSLAKFNPSALLQSLDILLPAMEDPNALQALDLTTRIEGSNHHLALEELNLNVDGSNFKGRVAMEDFAKQSLNITLNGNTLDLDRYLPPVSEAQQQAKAQRQQQVEQDTNTDKLPDAPQDTPWSTDPLLPLEPLRNLDAQLELTLSQLRVSQLPLDDFTLKTQIRNGQLQLNVLKGQLYDGKLSTTASLDARTDTPRLTLKTQIANAPLEPILKAQGKENIAKGALDLNTQLNARGNSQKAWMDTLTGHLNFTINNGALLGASLDQRLCQTIATVRGETLKTTETRDSTPFNELKGSLKIKNGLATNPDLKISIPGLKVEGRGDVDLRVLALDYRLGITIEGDRSEVPDEACQINDRYNNITWPLRCRGPLELAAKSCRPDTEHLGNLARQLAGSKVQEKIDSTLEEKLGDKAPALKEAIKGLFQR